MFTQTKSCLICCSFIIVSRHKNKEKAVSTTVKMSVVNIHHINGECPQFNVYVGHTYKDLAGSKWANPFSKFRYSEEECVTNFKEHFFTNPHLFLNIEQLKNKVLGCWCNDNKLCYARFLSDLANSCSEQRIWTD